MRGSFRLYRRYLAVSIKAQLQYRASFIMEMAAQFCGTIIEFLGIVVLFGRFGNLAGWQLAEVAFLYGLVYTTFAIADTLNHGFDFFANYVKSGDFDRMLLRPRGTVLQLLGVEFSLRRLGRMAQGLVVFGWAAANLTITWHPGKILILLHAVAGGAALFLGLFILQAALAFRTVESLEIANTLTYGGQETGSFPMTIYREGFRRFFTFVVPLSCVCYFPVLSVLEKQDTLHSPLWLGWVSPVAGFAFLAAALLVWRSGVKYYTSTGS